MIYKRPLMKCKECGEEKQHKAFHMCGECYDFLRNSKKVNSYRKKKKKTKIVTEDLVFRYYVERRYSISKIANILNRSHSGIQLILNRVGVKLRKEVNTKNNNLKHGYYRLNKLYRTEYPLCEICDWKYGIDLHHIKPISEGGKHTKNNLVSLCPNHHRMVHRKLIELQKEEGILICKDLTKLMEVD